MKTNMKNTTTRKSTKQTRAQILTAALGISFYAISLIGTTFIPATSIMWEIVFFTSFAIGSCFAIANVKLTPNVNRYRCENCDRIHIPEGSAILKRKPRLHCPACRQNAIHTIAVDDNVQKPKKKMTPAEKLATAVDVLTILMTLAIFMISDCVSPDCTWKGDVIGLLAILVVMGICACYRLERFNGSFVCSVCGQIHTPTPATILFCDNKGDDLILHCSNCDRQTLHEKVRPQLENTQETSIVG